MNQEMKIPVLMSEKTVNDKLFEIFPLFKFFPYADAHNGEVLGND
jgi:hypothetical protein